MSGDGLLLIGAACLLFYFIMKRRSKRQESTTSSRGTMAARYDGRRDSDRKKGTADGGSASVLADGDLDLDIDVEWPVRPSRRSDSDDDAPVPPAAQIHHFTPSSHRRDYDPPTRDHDQSSNDSPGDSDGGDGGGD